MASVRDDLSYSARATRLIDQFVADDAASIHAGTRNIANRAR